MALDLFPDAFETDRLAFVTTAGKILFTCSSWTMEGVKLAARDRTSSFRNKQSTFWWCVWLQEPTLGVLLREASNIVARISIRPALHLSTASFVQAMVL